MYKFALIGYPLTHSMSAIIHKAGMKDLGIDGDYEILETEPENLVDRLKYLKVNEYDGFNITIPLKVPVVMFLNSCDEKSSLAGSVNTVKIEEDMSLKGYNTDVNGFMMAIPEEKRLKLKNSKVAVLGLGGAARGAVVGLNEMGVSEIDFYVRNILNANQTIEFLRENFEKIKFNVYQISSAKDFSDAKMLVNTTPIGMKNHSADLMPVSKYAISSLEKDALVYDIVYNPIKTNFLTTAKSLGYQTISGVDMLIYQAQKAFEIWTGLTPKFEVMKLALYEELI